MLDSVLCAADRKISALGDGPVGEAQGDVDQLPSAVNPNDWNEIAIRCQGNRIQLWVNGYRTVDFRESEANIARTGVIGVQIHGGLPAEASYKDIRIKKLPRE